MKQTASPHPRWPHAMVSLAVLATLLSACATAAPTSVPAAPAADTPVAKPAEKAATEAPKKGATAAPTFTAGPTPTQNAGSTPVVGDKPVQGGKIIITWKSEFSSSDPVVGYTVQTWTLEHQLHRGLLAYDNKTKLQPDLAEALPTISGDGKVYTFKLRKGLKFSDGSPITAGDFKYSWERVFDPANKSPFPGFFSVIAGASDFSDSQNKGDGKVKDISGIKVVDDLTLQVTLDKADQSFLNVITMPPGAVVPKVVVEKYWDSGHKNNDFYKHAVGAGPYMVQDYQEGKGVTIVRNPNYWRAAEGLPHADSVEFQVGVDETTALLRIKNKEADISGDGIPGAEYPNLKSDPQYGKQVIASPIVAFGYVFLNTQMKPFDNKDIRLAFGYIFDRAKMLKLINNRGTPTGVIFPPNMPGYNDALNQEYLAKFDKAKAAEMLKAAKFDFDQTITFVAGDTDDSRKISNSLVQDMKDAGIKVELKFEQNEAFFKDFGKPNTIQIGYSNWYQDFPDPTDFIQPIISCSSAIDGGANGSFYCNKDIDALEIKARGEVDAPKRLQMYQEVEKQTMADQPWVPLYNPLNTDFISANLGGYFYHPVWQYEFDKWWKTTS